jgi:hypothetical protein
MAKATFQHVRAIGKKFERASVVLDNMWFDNCSVENCDIFNSWGPTGTRSCHFQSEVRTHRRKPEKDRTCARFCAAFQMPELTYRSPR